MPGDMLNASDYWGKQSDTAATCRDTPATGTPTCNGNGDGRVSHFDPQLPRAYEGWRAWQHLANAGLIEGSYTGARVTANWEGLNAGTNAPKGPMGSAVWVFFRLDTVNDTVSSFPILPYSREHVFAMGSTGGSGATAGNWTVPRTHPILRPQDAYNIDMKMDDGFPHRGKVMDAVGAADTPNCATDTGSATATYNLSQTQPACIFVGLTGY